jgi:hypothetical protein
MARSYKIWYTRPEFMRDIAYDVFPTADALWKTHIFLCSVEVSDDQGLDDIFIQMQGEVWSPNGEARPVIREKGLSHTSMSVGDVIHHCDSGEVWMVDRIGFKLIGKWEK